VLSFRGVAFLSQYAEFSILSNHQKIQQKISSGNLTSCIDYIYLLSF
jgi:hypothetical protein